MKEAQIKDLLRKYNSGEATDSEKTLLENWYFEYIQGQEFTDDGLDLGQLKTAIWEGTLERSRSGKSRRYYPWVAALALIIGAAALAYINYTEPAAHYTVTDLSQTEADIRPGGNAATLTLSDGRVIDLSQEKKGIVIGDDALSYSDGTAITSATTSGNNTTANNIIRTPRGGQYHVVLPDGSHVWLNAASSLEYPSGFDAEERRVRLKGEAYFEIARVNLNDKPKPFIVESPLQDVQVLGTHFNISAYTDQPVSTTLLEGSVRVVSEDQQTVQLIPGEQSIVEFGKDAKIVQADPYQAIGWKNGDFVFYDRTIANVMQDIARWYDVEVIYTDPVQEKKLWGSVSKFENISEVLKMLELTGMIRFDIEITETERRVYVRK